MRVVWTDHARVRQKAWEERLGITASIVDRVARSPEQVVPGRGSAKVAQARWRHGLIRVVFVDDGEERRLITGTGQAKRPVTGEVLKLEDPLRC